MFTYGLICFNNNYELLKKVFMDVDDGQEIELWELGNVFRTSFHLEFLFMLEKKVCESLKLNFCLNFKVSREDVK